MIKKCGLAIIILGLMASICWAAPQRAQLLDSRERAVGTQSNPLIVSFSGAQDIDGDTEISGSLSISKGLTLYDDLRVMDSVLFVDKSTGNVGIGNSAPKERLSIGPYTIAANPANDKYLALGSNVYYSDANWKRIVADYAAMILVDGEAGNLYLRTAGTAAADSTITWNTCMAANSSGNVGIGDTAPGARIDVKGSGSTSATQTAHFANSSDTDLFTILDNGNVGIGTASPEVILHTAGAIYSQLKLERTGGADGGAALLLENQPNNYWSIGINASTEPSNALVYTYNTLSASSSKFTIRTTGNVGIGTTSPAATLDVNGNARVGTVETTATDPYMNFDSNGVDAEIQVDGATVMSLTESGVNIGNLNIGVDLTSDGTNLFFKGEQITSH